ncbi:UNVERIFIED_CONTAM: Retrovirus-related Pol polyprotein from transposon TNT 1-94 [Sesamum angustifolium]|uniref:Retrovirus-related Pol polyprotein from transposon TNT 1-94 n=1 Tax=Sesamum angustifolium TaxID=2727405 RepID=A0AAW2IXR5_9LAMI
MQMDQYRSTRLRLVAKGYSQLPDDLMYTGNNEKMIQDFKQDMLKTFEMSDLGLMHFFFGIEINQEKREYLYSNEVRRLSRSSKWKAARQLLLLWLLAKSTRKKMDHKKSMAPSAKRILRYLRGTKDFGIWYKSTNDAKSVGYTDSDWAGSVDDMKSTSGYTFFTWVRNIHMGFQETSYCGTILSQSRIHWQLLQHQIMLFGLEGSLEDMGEKQRGATTIYCDNKSAIAITKNSVQHSRTKHIDIKYHSGEATTRGEIELKYCSTEEQLADIFTKELPRNKFEEQHEDRSLQNNIKGEY